MESVKECRCFLIREEPIQRLPRLVVAASEACRRMVGDAQSRKAALSQAIAAKCPDCGFALSGEELLALAGISGANERSTQLKRLRDGHCARDGCTSSHYHLIFYDTPGITWSTVLAEHRPQETAEPQPAPAPRKAPLQWIPLAKIAQVAGVIVLCLLAWMWWQWHSGGRIPFLREPEHFKVTPGADPIHYH